MPVVGRGTLANGHGFYLVPSSSDPTRYYAVEQLPGRLVCLCKDAFFRRRVFADAGAESASVARVTTRRKKQPARQKPPDVAGCHQLRDSARDTAHVRRDQRPLSARFMR